MNQKHRAIAQLLATLTRLTSSLSKHQAKLLIAAAAMPFLPSAYQFMHQGVPDVLSTGDAAVCEIRMMHAAHGTQLLGPYSRFQWSHPGPAFFYLALPIYEAFHRRGPALNLFALITNFASVVALALSARRLRGSLFALNVVTLVAVCVCLGPPFGLSNPWNPIIPALPLALLSFLCVRIALAHLAILPLFAFVASAVVQTHIGYLPAVLVLSTLAAAFHFERRIRARRTLAAATFISSGARHAPHRRVGALVASACVLLILWWPPLIENARGQPGNLELLYQFFTAPHAPEHAWRIVLETVASQLSVMPLAVGRVFGISCTPSFALAVGLTVGEVAALAAALVSGLRHQDRVLSALASIALAEIAVAFMAVRAIRGEIYPYLVVWISIAGLLSTATVAAWIVPAMVRALPRVAGVGLTVGALAALGVCVREEARHTRVFPPADEGVERLARDIHRFVVAQHIDHPVISIPAHEAWPVAAAVILYIYKQATPVFVERQWLFMMGTQFAARSQEHPLLVIGDRERCASARTRLDFRLIANADDSCGLLRDPNYLLGPTSTLPHTPSPP